MTSDSRILWIENRIQNSIRPKIDELKSVFNNDKYLRNIRYFLNVAHCRLLFGYYEDQESSSKLRIVNECPENFSRKAILFCKNNSVKITQENIDEEVTCTDINSEVIDYSQSIVREIFLPLVCGVASAPNISRRQSSIYNELASRHQLQTAQFNQSDKMLDLVHRFMANIQVAGGFTKQSIILAQPNLDVLQDILANEKRRGTVLQVLETTVINWCKQLKIILQRENLTSNQIQNQVDPLTEIQQWHQHLSSVVDVLQQLYSPLTREILANLEHVNSQYYYSFQDLMIEVSEEKLHTKDMLHFLAPLEKWFQRYQNTRNVDDIIALIPALLRLIFLLWRYNKYYHYEENIYRFLKLFGKSLLTKVLEIVGNYKEKTSDENLQNFKNALKICAKFRGTYLDTRDSVDEVNRRHEEENAQLTNQSNHDELWRTKLYGPHAYRNPYVTRTDSSALAESNTTDELMDELCIVSHWPARNSKCFEQLNAFIQRCNDCVELLQSSEHFRTLSDVAKIGGAATLTLNSMVTEIDNRYQLAINHFYSKVDDILDLTSPAKFERAFFEFRCVVKSLEQALGIIIDNSLDLCTTVESKLHLIEVFEGISSRDIVQRFLHPKLKGITEDFYKEINEVVSIVSNDLRLDQTLEGRNMPRFINQLIALDALTQRISKPFAKLNQLFPNVFISNDGYKLKGNINEAISLCQQKKQMIIKEWKENIEANDLTESLKQPILIVENLDLEAEEPPSITVNMNEKLILFLHEIKLIRKLQLDVSLDNDTSIQQIVQSVETIDLVLMCNKMHLVQQQFNRSMLAMSIFERNLFSKELDKINEMLQIGSEQYSWKMPETYNFIEQMLFLVCHDFDRKLIGLQTNFDEIIDIGNSWNDKTRELFHGEETSVGDHCTTHQIQEIHRNAENQIHSKLVWSQVKIERIMENTLKIVDINQDSPAWISYIDFIDSMLMESLKTSILSSLTTLYHHITMENSENEKNPLLSVNLDLINEQVEFLIPLHTKINRQSIPEIVLNWAYQYLDRARLIKLINNMTVVYDDNTNEAEDMRDSSFYQLIKQDEDINNYLNKIKQLIENIVEEAAKVTDNFQDYSFLWKPKIDESFNSFLHGSVSPNKLRSSSRANYRTVSMIKSRGESRASSSVSKATPSEEQSAERSFLTPKNMKDFEFKNIPCLDDFNTEIDLYKSAIEEMERMPNNEDYQCLRVIFDPLRQVLIVHAQSWIWKYAQFLVEQVDNMLQDLEAFLQRVEPQIDAITGNEKDTVSFMRLMRVFNEIASQQSVTQYKFLAMHRAVDIVQVYASNLLSEELQAMYLSLPERWTNLKTKVSLAKQRLGPRIQTQSETVSKDLLDFKERVNNFSVELSKSEVFMYNCPLEGARVMLDNFDKRVKILKNEASDLIELQNLLENDIVNFETISKCMTEIEALRKTWDINRQVQADHAEWCRHRWQKINPEFLLQATAKQLEITDALPDIAKNWDIWLKLRESIEDIRICVPLLTDLSNKTMRTRHWKQMVRATGGAIHIDSDVLRHMTFGELLNLGLQKHLNEVKMIVDRANQDLTIENSLRTYEEVWISKVFSFKLCSIHEISSNDDDRRTSLGDTTENHESSSRIGRRSIAGSRNQISSSSKNRSRTVSSVSLPQSLNNILENVDSSSINQLNLIDNTDEIFTRLNQHQRSLELMTNDSSNIGSFLDEVLRWQTQLRNIELVLRNWLIVQTKWQRLYQLLSWDEIKQALPNDLSKFKNTHRDFMLLMLATKKNPNILQCCNRKNILNFLEELKSRLILSLKSVEMYLNRREHKYPRLFSLNKEDLVELLGSDHNDIHLKLGILWPTVIRLVFDDPSSEAVDSSHNQQILISSLILQHNERLPKFTEPVSLNQPPDMWMSQIDIQYKNLQKKTLKQLLTQFKEINDYKLLFDSKAEKTEEFHKITIESSTEMMVLSLKIHLTKLIDTNLDNLEQLSELLIQFQSIIQLFQDNKSDYTFKLSNLYTVFINYTQLLIRIQGLTDLDNRHTLWDSTLKYYLNEELENESNNDESLKVFVKIHDNQYQYGFNICSTDNNFDINWIDSNDLENVLNCDERFDGGICYTDQDIQPEFILRCVAASLGRDLCVFDCSRQTNKEDLMRMMKCHLFSDNWVCARNIGRLSHEMSTIFTMLFELKKFNSTQTQHSLLALTDSDINFEKAFTESRFYVTLDRTKPDFSPITNYINVPIVYSALVNIPQAILHKFRIIYLRKINFADQIHHILMKSGLQETDKYACQAMDLIQIINDMISILSDKQDMVIHEILSYVLIDRLYEMVCQVKQNSSDVNDEQSILIEAIRRVCFNITPKSVWNEIDLIIKEFSECHLNSYSQVKEEKQFENYFESIVSSESINNSEHLKELSLRVYSNLTHHKILAICGPPGTGKSLATKLALDARQFILKENLFDKQLYTDRIYPESYEDFILINSQSSPNIMDQVLKNFHQNTNFNVISDFEYYLIIDGSISTRIIESCSGYLTGSNSAILEDNCRLNLLPDRLSFLFEQEHLSHLHPGLLTDMAIIVVSPEHDSLLVSNNVWMDILHNRLSTFKPKKKTLLKSRLELFIPKALSRITNINKKFHSFNFTFKQTTVGMLQTFGSYFTSLLNSNVQSSLSIEVIDLIICYSLLWSFGSHMSCDSKVIFSSFLKELFQLDLNTQDLFELSLDIDKLKWTPWCDLVTSQSIIRNSGFQLDRIVRTPKLEAAHYNLSLLTDNGCAVLITGDTGSGKSAFVKDRLKTLCSGEVAEIINISIGTSIYTRSWHVTEKLSEQLQWQHTNIYTAVGNKKLILFLDDLQCAVQTGSGSGAITDVLRQLLDSQGIWQVSRSQLSSSNHDSSNNLTHESTGLSNFRDVDQDQFKCSATYKLINNVNIIATVNSKFNGNLRFLRHFNVININYPSFEDQVGIFTSLFKGHLFGSTSGKIENQDNELSRIIEYLIRISVDLQDRINRELEPIPRYAHYYFNMSSLVQLYYNLCEVISVDNDTGSTDIKKLILLWRNEVNFIYKWRMANSLHIQKFTECYTASVKSNLAEIYKPMDLPLRLLLDTNYPLCTSIRVLDTGYVTSLSPSYYNNKLSNNNTDDNNNNTDNSNQTNNNQETTNSDPEIATTTNENDSGASGQSSVSANQINSRLNYHPIRDEHRLKKMIVAALVEFNKINPAINIYLHQQNVQAISRLAHSMTIGDNMGHSFILAEGSPGLSTNLVKLSAYIAGFKVITSNNNRMLDSTQYTLPEFKFDLNTLFTAAGSKNQRICLVIRDRDLSVLGVTDCIRNLVIHQSIDELFTIEQKTHIINAVRTEVVRSGMNYSRDVAWQFFIKNVIRNFRLAIILSDVQLPSLHLWMQHNSQLIGRLNMITATSWTKPQLCQVAQSIISDHYQLNIAQNHLESNACAHLLAQLHSVTRQIDLSQTKSSVGCDQRIVDHSVINNSMYESFLSKFCQIFKHRSEVIDRDANQIDKLLNVIEKQTQLAQRLHNQLEHETRVLSNKIEGANSILKQIGENTVIVKTQMKVIQAQIGDVKQLKRLVPEYKVAHDRYSYKSIAAYNKAREVIKNMDIDNLIELRAKINPIAEVVELIASIIMILKAPNVDMTWNTGGKRLLANLERFTTELLTFDERSISLSTLETIEARLAKDTFQSEVIMERSQMSSCRDLSIWLSYTAKYFRIMMSKVQPLHQKLEQTTRQVSDAESQMKLLDDKSEALNSRLVDLASSFQNATLDRYNQQIKSDKVAEMFSTSSKLLELLNTEESNARLLKSSYHRRRQNLMGSCAITSAFVVYLGRFDVAHRRYLISSYMRCLIERGLLLVFDSVDPAKGYQILFEYPQNTKLDQTQNQAKDAPIDSQETDRQSQVSSLASTEVHNEMLTESQYQALVKSIARFIFGEQNPQLIALNNIRILELEQSIFICGNSDKLNIIIDPSKRARKFFENKWSMLRDVLHSDEELINMNTNDLSSHSFMNRLEEYVSRGQNLLIETNVMKLDQYIESINQYLLYKSHSSHLKSSSTDINSQFITFGSRKLLAHPNFSAIIFSDESNYQQDMELQSIVNIIDCNFSYHQMADVMAEFCFKNVADNYQNLVKSQMKVENYRYYLAYLMGELSVILYKSSSYLGQIWTNENLSLLKTIIDKIINAKSQMAHYEQMISHVEIGRMAIRSALSKPEIIIRCFTVFNQINGRILANSNFILQIFLKILNKHSEHSIIDDIDQEKSVENESKPTLKLFNFGNSSVADESKILKWSSIADIKDLQTGNEDYDELVNQLLASIDNEEKNIMAQEITKIRTKKPPLALRSFDFYLQRRGYPCPKQTWLKDKTKPSEESQLAVESSSEYNGLNLEQDVATNQMNMQQKLRQLQEITEYFGLEDYSQQEAPDTSEEQTNESSLDPVKLITLPTEVLDKTIAEFECVMLHKLALCLTVEEYYVYRFIYYICVNEDISNTPGPYELEFFINGTKKPDLKLSLKDFNSNLPEPDWLSPSQWSGILAASCLIGPLYELCIQIAQYSDEWNNWFNNLTSKTLFDDVPYNDNNKPTAGDNESTSIELSNRLNKFHKLILIKLFRPELCSEFIQSFVISIDQTKSEDQTDDSENRFSSDLDWIVSQYNLGKISCVIVTESNCTQLEHNTQFPGALPSMNLTSTVSQLTQLADLKSKKISSLCCASLNPTIMWSILNSDSKNFEWIVFRNIEDRYDDFKDIIQRYVNMAELTSVDSQPEMVWFVVNSNWRELSQFTANLPDNCLIISQEHLVDILSSTNQSLSLNRSIIESNVVGVLSVFSRASQLIQSTKNAGLTDSHLWSLVVINLCLVLRQIIGSRALSLWQPMCASLVIDQIEYLQTYRDQFGADDKFIERFIERVEFKMFHDETDIKYLRQLMKIVISGAASGKIQFRSIEVILPGVFSDDIQSNINQFVSSNQSWISTNENIVDLCQVDPYSIQPSELHTTHCYLDTLNRFFNTNNPNQWLCNLDFIGSSQSNLQRFDDVTSIVLANSLRQLSSIQLRSKAVFVEESLPQIICVTKDFIPTALNKVLPSSCKSLTDTTTSIESIQNIHKFEMVAPIIIQEIHQFNLNITRINTQLTEIIKATSSTSHLHELPPNLLDICLYLVRECVPPEWFSISGYQPSVLDLKDFSLYLNSRHNLLNKWNEAIIHNFNGKFKLLPLWLGGLSRPKRALIQLRKCFITNYKDAIHLDQLVIVGVHRQDKSMQSIDKSSSLSVSSWWCVGAQWSSTFCLEVIASNAKSNLTKFDEICLYVVTKETLSKLSINQNYYRSVIYSDSSRTKIIDHVFIKSQETNSLEQTGVFFVLNSHSEITEPGKENIAVLLPVNLSITGSPPLSPVGDHLTSPRIMQQFNPNIRQYNLLSQPPAAGLYTLREEEEVTTSILATDTINKDPICSETNRTNPNHSSSEEKSQMSYRPYTPNAEPLPTELSMEREKDNLIGANDVETVANYDDNDDDNDNRDGEDLTNTDNGITEDHDSENNDKIENHSDDKKEVEERLDTNQEEKTVESEEENKEIEQKFEENSKQSGENINTEEMESSQRTEEETHQEDAQQVEVSEEINQVEIESSQQLQEESQIIDEQTKEEQVNDSTELNNQNDKDLQEDISTSSSDEN